MYFNGQVMSANAEFTGDGTGGTTPHIGDNGNWFIGDTDTGMPSRGADGITPHIGENGNWFIGDTDTGMPSRGTNGNDGKSPNVTVSRIEGGDESGAHISVTYPDGTFSSTFVNDGKNGYTPVKGVDYFTDADKAAMVAAVIESLGGNPIFGVVDDNNNIIVSGNLSAGTYSVKYEMEDGSAVDIGQLTLAADEPDEPVQTYTNHANPNDANWKEGFRLNSSYTEVEAAGMVTTNLIAATKGAVIRVKGLSFGGSSNERVVQYLNETTANNALVSTVNTDLFSTSGGITTITLDGSAVMGSSTYIRICGTLTGTSDEVIITINEEII